MDGVPARNLGCVCASTGAPLYCRDRLADMRLWTATYYDVVDGDDDGDGGTMETMSLPKYCIRKCDCRALTRGKSENAAAAVVGEQVRQGLGGRMEGNSSTGVGD